MQKIEKSRDGRSTDRSTAGGTDKNPDRNPDGKGAQRNTGGNIGEIGRDTGRDYNVELIRILSCVMVIVIHVTNYYCRAYGDIGQGEYLFSLLLNTLSRVSVPCFFMISGAFLLAVQDTVRDYAQRLKRFVPVLAVWSAVYYCWNTFYIGAGYDLREILCVPVERHLWYLYAMIPVYLVLPFFQMIFKAMDRKWEFLFLIVTGGAVVFNYLTSLADSRAYYDLPLVGDRVYSFYVFLGYFLYKYRKEIRIGQKTSGSPVRRMCGSRGRSDAGRIAGRRRSLRESASVRRSSHRRHERGIFPLFSAAKGRKNTASGAPEAADGSAESVFFRDLSDTYSLLYSI